MAGKIHGNAGEVWCSARELRRIFGVADKTLTDRSVNSRKGAGRVEFELADFWNKCANLVWSKARESGLGASLEDAEGLKVEKLAEEVRKLRLGNDEIDGLLVRADEVESTYNRGVKAMADVLDSMVSRVKMRCPTLDQAALAEIQECLTEARRKAARVPVPDE